MDNMLKIVNWLGKHPGRGFTMHELSRTLDIPYATFHRTVQRMGELLHIVQVGKSRSVQLNLGSHVAKAYLTIAAEEEKKEYLAGQPVIRKIANELKTDDVVALFGSYAKKTQTAKSDIDLLIINKDGRKSISFSTYELLYRKKVHAVFVTKKEFVQMLKATEENVAKQALQKHVILNNPEAFWGAVLHAL